MKKLIWDVYFYLSGAKDLTPFSMGLTKTERRKTIGIAKNHLKSNKQTGLVVSYVDNQFHSSF